MMCLEKEPAKRPPDAEFLARLLEGCDDVGSWTPDDAERWWRTHMPEDVVQMNDDSQPWQADPYDLPTL
jgi:hypothetical protein